MLRFVIFAVALAEAAFYEDHYHDVQQMLNKAQKENGKNVWKFGLNEYFAGKSLPEIRMLMGYDKENLHAANEVPIPSEEEKLLIDMSIELPTSFDARENWPECKKIISHIKDQSTCGSCWAVSAVSVMSDRNCISSKGADAVALSDDEVLSCCKNCGYGCNGGYPQRAMKYWVDHGVPTGGPYGDETCCKPYSIEPCQGPKCKAALTPKCSKQCIKQYSVALDADRRYGKTWFNFWFGETSMMRDIYLNGPIVAGFIVYSDFMYYKSGVYEHKTGSRLGGHAVRIIGWGEESGTKYWLVANSWNTTFGMDGYFKIKRGVYECGIEYAASSGYAKATKSV